MVLRTPSETELFEAGSLKWTGATTDAGVPTLGAWVAEMDFGTSPAVQNRLVKAVNEGFLGYLPRWAPDAVAEALVDLADRRFGWVIKPDWVRLSRGVMPAFHATIEYMTHPGSAVIVPTPAYMPFLSIPQQHGRELIEVPALHTPNATEPKEAWALDLLGIKAGLDAGAGLIVLCNPWNPTGRVLSVEELRALHDLAADYEVLIFSDEVHAPLVYGDPSSFVSYAALGPTYAANTITAVAASKAWNVAGLNCAQVVLPDAALRQKWDEAASDACGGACALGAIAAIEAYTNSDGWLAEVIEQISTNLDDLDEALAGTKVDYSRPEGTYLAWIGFDDYDLEGRIVDVLREEHRVTVNDGVTLGAPYKNWIRVNAAMSPEPWKLVVAAIKEVAGA